MFDSPYFRALETALQGAGLPYGYAITVWCTGSVLTGERGMPSLVGIFLFAAGATVAYGGLRLLLSANMGGEADRPLTRSPNTIRAGAVHLAAIGLAITSALLVAKLGGGAAWALAPFAATLLYLGVSSIEVALVEDKHA
jgi:hypothetical protein